LRKENTTLEVIQGGSRFFFAEAINGINTLFGQCRRKFRFVFGSELRTERTTFGQNPYATLQKVADGFEDWKNIVSGGQIENLKGLTYYDFMFKLDKAIERNRKEMALQAKKQNNG